MRARRPSAPFPDDMPPEDPVFDVVPDADDAPPMPSSRPSRGDPTPVEVCLACGAADPGGGECPHDEVARLEAPTPAILAAVARLHHAWQERRQQARALHKLVTTEVTAGRGEVRVAARPAPPAPLAVPAATGEPAATAPRASRKRATSEAQAYFAFAAPPPPPPSPPPPPEPEALASADVTDVTDAPKPRGRKKKRAAREPASDDAAGR